MEIRHIRGKKFGEVLLLRVNQQEFDYIDSPELLAKEPKARKILNDLLDKTISSRTAVYPWDKEVVVEARTDIVFNIQQRIKADTGSSVKIVVNQNLGKRTPKR
jgi:hypothetical protein